MDATRILPKLYQGSLPPEGRELADRGFDVLVLCAEEHQPSGRKFPGVQVYHAPLDDHDLSAVEARIAERAAEAVRRHVLRGERVLVTCAMGRNRSGLVVALAILKLTAMTGFDAATLVRRGRAGALSNPSFVDAVVSYGRRERRTVRLQRLA